MKHTLTLAALAASLALVQLTGCAVARDQQSVGSYIDDTAVTARVKARFAEDPVVAATSIGVETLQGTVQLTGFAKTHTERESAERIARTTPGVKEVRNDIVVR